MNLIVIGEILWDVFPTGDRLGGAPFNFAAHSARLGHQVHFVSGAGADPRGETALEEMRRLGVSTRWMARTDQAPTGYVTVALQAGEPHYTIHRPAAYDFPALDDAQLPALAATQPDVIYYGTLAQSSPAVRSATRRIIDACPNATTFYDINLRPANDDLSLVATLLCQANLVKLNEDEARRIASAWQLPASPIEAFCRALSSRSPIHGVCITLGAKGCALLLDGVYAECPGVPVPVSDLVGAGDAFSAALIDAISRHLPPNEAGAFANRLGAFVASRPGALPEWTEADLDRL